MKRLKLPRPVGFVGQGGQGELTQHILQNHSLGAMDPPALDAAATGARELCCGGNLTAVFDGRSEAFGDQGQTWLVSASATIITWRLRRRAGHAAQGLAPRRPGALLVVT